jgi:hypothetical protein
MLCRDCDYHTEEEGTEAGGMCGCDCHTEEGTQAYISLGLDAEVCPLPLS